jgi:hypothetical protein
MGQDFSKLVYAHGYDTFARAVNFTPKLGLPFSGRGVYDSRSIDVQTEAGVILADQETILDIIEAEYPVMPVQGDIVDIPADGPVPAAGQFEVIILSTNTVETTLTLRQIKTATP